MHSSRATTQAANVPRTNFSGLEEEEEAAQRIMLAATEATTPCMQDSMTRKGPLIASLAAQAAAAANGIL